MRSDYLANQLSIAGKGHIRVEDPVAWKLSGGFPLEDKAGSGAEEYTISLFHQLHCLVGTGPDILNNYRASNVYHPFRQQ